jgi:gamma-glutamylcyclotransferase (GGCT)/AIG2-like uncharacterized protein YtfP
VQQSLFQRTLTGQKDELVGFEQSMVKIECPGAIAAGIDKYHINVVRNGRSDSRVSGSVFEITDAELAAADDYEQADGYERTITTLASGKEAWVYAYAR